MFLIVGFYTNVLFIFDNNLRKSHNDKINCVWLSFNFISNISALPGGSYLNQDVFYFERELVQAAVKLK